MSEMGVDGERDQFMETNSICTFLSRTKGILLLVNGGREYIERLFSIQAVHSKSVKIIDSLESVPEPSSGYN